TWLLISISDQLDFSLRPLTTTVESWRAKVLLPCFAFLTVTCVWLIAVTIPPKASLAAGRCLVVGLGDAAAGAAITPVASTAASTPDAAIPAMTLPNM